MIAHGAFAIRRPFFFGRRHRSREELAAIHAKQAQTQGKLARLHESWIKVNEPEPEKARVKFVGKYGRAARGRPVSQGTVLGRQQYAISQEIRKLGVEHIKHQQQLEELGKQQLIRGAKIAAIAAIPITGAALVKTKAGRRILARGLTNFRPLKPFEMAADEARIKLHGLIERGAGELEKTGHRGVAAANSRFWDYIMGQSHERLARKGGLSPEMRSIEKHMKRVGLKKGQTLAAALQASERLFGGESPDAYAAWKTAMQSEGNMAPGLIDRMREGWWRNIVYPTFSRPDKKLEQMKGLRGLIYRWVQRPIGNMTRLNLDEGAYDTGESALMRIHRRRRWLESSQKEIGRGVPKPASQNRPEGHSPFFLRRHGKGTLREVRLANLVHLQRDWSQKLSDKAMVEGQRNVARRFLDWRPKAPPASRANVEAMLAGRERAIAAEVKGPGTLGPTRVVRVGNENKLEKALSGPTYTPRISTKAVKRQELRPVTVFSPKVARERVKALDSELEKLSKQYARVGGQTAKGEAPEARLKSLELQIEAKEKLRAEVAKIAEHKPTTARLTEDGVVVVPVRGKKTAEERKAIQEALARFKESGGQIEKKPAQKEDFNPYST